MNKKNFGMMKYEYNKIKRKALLIPSEVKLESELVYIILY